MRDDGLVAGSVSGGCVEDDLIDRVRNGERVGKPSLVAYGVTKEEAARFGLPCGGNLRLVQEPLDDIALDRRGARAHRPARAGRARRSTSTAARSASSRPRRGEAFTFDGRHAAGAVRAALADADHRCRPALARAGADGAGLDFEVIVCDPREEYHLTWDVPGTTFSTAMPDDLAIELQLDPHTAVVAVTHDPKLDDLVLLEALKSPAFYVGALGSRGNTAKRKERLALFDLSAAEIERLHGPIGLDIGSRTPAEIAVSILAEIIAVRNGVALTQKKPVRGRGVRRSAPPRSDVIPWLRERRPTRCPTPSWRSAAGERGARPASRPAASSTPARLAEAYAQGHLPLVQRRPAGPVVVARPAHGAAAGRVPARPVAAEDDPRTSLARRRCEIRIDTAFRRVIAGLRDDAARAASAGTWIVPEMIDAYAAWHDAGRVHSVETWIDGELAGGLYGVCARPHVLRRVDVRAPHRRLEDRAGGAGRLLPRPRHRDHRLPAAHRPPRLASAAGRCRAPSSMQRLGTALAMPPVDDWTYDLRLWRQLGIRRAPPRTPRS